MENEAGNSVDKIKLFRSRNNTIITTNREVKAHQVMWFLKDEIKMGKFPEGSEFQIYCGNHGTKDGKLGDEPHHKFFRAIQSGIRLLDKELNFKFKFEAERLDVKGGKLGDEPHDKFLKQNDSMQKEIYGDIDIVKKKFQDDAEYLFDATTNRDSKDQNRHTVMVFAYCFSDYNEFKEFLQEAGVVSVMMVKNERGEITRGNCFKLDRKQGELLRIIKDDHLDNECFDDLKVKHVLLSGSFGTGKTVVLVEIYWMRINYLLRQKRDNNADNDIKSWIFTGDQDGIRGANQLRKQFEDFYFSECPKNLDEPKIGTLSDHFGDEEDISVAYLNKVIQDISRKYPSPTINVIFVDELVIPGKMFEEDGESPLKKADFSGLNVSLPNILLLIAFNPTGVCPKGIKQGKFRIQTPGYENKDSIDINGILEKCSEKIYQNTLYQQFLVGYRCAKPIADLSNYFREHDLKFGFAQNQLNFSKDQKEVKNLPEGQEYPIVIIRTENNREKNVTLNKLVNHIIDKYAKDFSTTIIYNEKAAKRQVLKVENSDKKKKIVTITESQGIEDEFIIYLLNYSYQTLRLNDALTRARNRFAIVFDTDIAYYNEFREDIIEIKNHEKENHHCKALNKSVVNQCSFKMEELIKVYKIDNNASVEDSNFLLKELKGEPKFNEVENCFHWDDLPPDEFKKPLKRSDNVIHGRSPRKKEKY